MTHQHQIPLTRFCGKILCTLALASYFHDSAQLNAQEQPSAQEPVIDLEPYMIHGKSDNLTGVAFAASEGTASVGEFADRPFLRRGELLEVVPGMVITQHSGGGKANQYFLRGFNLDHGTDFAISVEGIPVNLRTHAHGQGYADMNFVIPELVERLDFAKGPFDSGNRDFSSAGAAHFHFFHQLPSNFASLTVGENNYRRFVGGNSFKTGKGTLTVAGEYSHNDGPWVLPEGFELENGFVRYHWGDEKNFAMLTIMAYNATWGATDQIPKRLIVSGAIDRLGYVDPTVGGSSQRHSFSFETVRNMGEAEFKANAYAGYYTLDLYSNFTLFLEDPVNGDQFNQYDSRWFAGADISMRWERPALLKNASAITVGLQSQTDWINDIGLYKTSARQRLSTVRQDDVVETSLSLYANVEMQWNDWIRGRLGLRGDLYHFDVESLLPENSGSEWDSIVSPKASLILGPWRNTELYLNAGYGFHSNDARGVTITTDPVSGDPLDPVDPLVRTFGSEIGVRTQVMKGLVSTLTFWHLDSDSELVYVGDAGNIEAGDASHRYGVEWAGYWQATPWLYLDAELAFTEAEFKDSDEYIENSVPAVFSGGITVARSYGPFAQLRTRYFAPRPLTGDKSIESQSALEFNLKVGYRRERWMLALDILNLFDAQDNDIEYYYASRVAGEPAEGVEDIHLHPFEPRQFRFSAVYRW